uniref:DUF4371 domain-containing protein n=1 Tax=Octopus bimaculoides TaxID=37653 RepID=A0A0L8HH86_OCTBM
MAEDLDKQLVETLRISKFSFQIDETNIRNSSLLLAYARYFDEEMLEEMLFLKKLPDTKSETIFSAVHRYLQQKGIPLEKLFQIATDGSCAMTGKHNGGDMEMALQVVVSAVNFIKANAFHDRIFQKLCENDHQTLLMHTEVRWLSKGDSLLRLAEMWTMALSFVNLMKSQACPKKQIDKANALFSAMNEDDTKAKIFYLADLFSHRDTTAVECVEKIRPFVIKLNLWQLHLQKRVFTFFGNLVKASSSSDVIASFTNHLESLREGINRWFKDVIEIKPTKSISDVAHFDVLSEDSIDPIIATDLVELKENNHLTPKRRIDGMVGSEILISCPLRKGVALSLMVSYNVFG